MRIATSTIYAQQTAAIDDQTAALRAGQPAALERKAAREPERRSRADRAGPQAAHGDRRDDAAVDERAERGLGADDDRQRAEQPYLRAAERAPAGRAGIDGYAHGPAAQRRSGRRSTSCCSSRSRSATRPTPASTSSPGRRRRRTRRSSNRGTRSRPSASPATSKRRGSWSTTASSSRSRRRFGAVFNYQSADGSPDVFQTLITLRNTLANQTAVDQSAARDQPGRRGRLRPARRPVVAAADDARRAERLRRRTGRRQQRQLFDHDQRHRQRRAGNLDDHGPARRGARRRRRTPGGTSLVAKINAVTRDDRRHRLVQREDAAHRR